VVATVGGGIARLGLLRLRYRSGRFESAAIAFCLWMLTDDMPPGGLQRKLRIGKPAIMPRIPPALPMLFPMARPPEQIVYRIS
jgi:hypothetical protein